MKYVGNLVCVCTCVSVQFSRSVVSNSLQPHESQHARTPCLSPTPRVYSDSCVKLVISSSHLILCRPLFLLPPIPPSIRVFSYDSTLRMRWANGVLPREHTGHSKHPLPTTQEKTLHMDITRWSTLKSNLVIREDK